MNEEQRVEIERYLDGGMSPEEAASFLAGLKQDPEARACLGQALDQQALLYDGVRARTSEEGTRGMPRARARRLRGWRADSSGPGAAWIAGLAAACALLAIGLSLALRKPVPPAPKPAPDTAASETPGIPEPAPPRQPEPGPGTPEAPPEPPVREPGRTAPTTPDRAPSPAPPEVRPEMPLEPPVPAPVPPAPREKGTTAAAIARIERAEGDVTIPDGTEVKANHVVLDGQGLKTSGRGSLAVVRFTDGTRIEAGGDTLVREIRVEGGRRVILEQGTLSADVVRQAPGASMVFATPHGEATVLGTALKLAVDPEKTRLEVAEGRVRLKRLQDGKAVDVAAGHYAVAAAGVNLAARPLPIDEILILPHQGIIGGGEWRLVRDANASSGLALENPRTSNRFPDGVNTDASRVVFTFRADADRTYTVWVRGCTLASKDPIAHDAVFLEWSEAQPAETPGVNKGKGGDPMRTLANGFMHRPGYWWVGGDADGEGDAASPVTVRFNRAGWQTVKVYGYEPPVRIDALWLSATQKTRPPDASPGPR